MEKIAIGKLIDFGRKGAIARQTIVNNLKMPQVKKDDGSGGDYWISALSAISNAFIENKNELINEKVDKLIDKIEEAEAKITKDMFQRNINILYNFEDYDFPSLKPNADLTYLKKPKDKSIIIIKGLPLFVNPNHVFTFEENGVKKIGAIWFVAKLNGFRPEELAIVVDILFRYLDTYYSDKFEIDTNFCLVKDVSILNKISYTQIMNAEVRSPLKQTLEEIKELL